MRAINTHWLDAINFKMQQSASPTIRQKTLNKKQDKFIKNINGSVKMHEHKYIVT